MAVFFKVDGISVAGRFSSYAQRIFGVQTSDTATKLFVFSEIGEPSAREPGDKEGQPGSIEVFFWRGVRYCFTG